MKFKLTNSILEFYKIFSIYIRISQKSFLLLQPETKQ